MTIFTAPPDQTGLIVGGDNILNVNSGGAAIRTTLVSGGVENVNSGGASYFTTIRFGGAENVYKGGTDTGTSINQLGLVNVDGGTSSDTTLNSGGRENVEHGGTANRTMIYWRLAEFIIGLGSVSSGVIIDGGAETVAGGATSYVTIINQSGVETLGDGGNSYDTMVNGGGQETVGRGGKANNTTIAGGVEHVNPGGAAKNVIFGGPDAVLELGRPSGLKGIVSGWQVGDVIDFQNTSVTSVQENDAHTILTVHYATRLHPETATYSLVNSAGEYGVCAPR